MRENKENMIALRLSSTQLKYVNSWARQHGVSVSEVIRLAIQHMIPEAKA